MKYSRTIVFAIILAFTLTACGGGGGSSSSEQSDAADSDTSTNTDGAAAEGDQRFAYVTEQFSNELSRVDLSTGHIDTVTDQLVGPSDVAISNNGELAYISEYDGSALSKVALDDGAITTLVTGLTAPLDVDVMPNGHLLLLNATVGLRGDFRTELLLIDPDTGETDLITNGLFQATDMVLESGDDNSVLVIAEGDDSTFPDNDSLRGIFEIYRVKLDTGEIELVGASFNTGLVEITADRAQVDIEIGQSDLAGDDRAFVDAIFDVNLTTGNNDRLLYNGVQPFGADFVFEKDSPSLISVASNQIVRANTESKEVEIIASDPNLFSNPTGIDLSP